MNDIKYIRYIIENLILILEESMQEVESITYKEEQENNDYTIETLIKYIFEYVELYAKKLGIKATTELFNESYLIKYNGIGYEIGIINDLNKTYYYKMVPLVASKKFININGLDYEYLDNKNERTLTLN